MNDHMSFICHSLGMLGDQQTTLGCSKMSQCYTKCAGCILEKGSRIIGKFNLSLNRVIEICVAHGVFIIDHGLLFLCTRACCALSLALTSERDLIRLRLES